MRQPAVTFQSVRELTIYRLSEGSVIPSEQQKRIQLEFVSILFGGKNPPYNHPNGLTRKTFTFHMQTWNMKIR